MSISLNIRDCRELVNLFHCKKCSIDISDTSIRVFDVFQDLPGEYQKRPVQKALIYSAMQVTPTYHVAAVWLPECEMYNSDFAIIHVNDGVITKAAMTDSDERYHQIILDGIDNFFGIYAVVSVGYDLYYQDEVPVASWFRLVADSPAKVHHRQARKVRGMKSEYSLSSC